eukprot:2354913-Pleurochrysis_carterae.AAC.2
MAYVQRFISRSLIPAIEGAALGARGDGAVRLHHLRARRVTRVDEAQRSSTQVQAQADAHCNICTLHLCTRARACAESTDECTAKHHRREVYACGSMRT